jgi:hypothetical protein
MIPKDQRRRGRRGISQINSILAPGASRVPAFTSTKQFRIAADLSSKVDRP